MRKHDRHGFRSDSEDKESNDGGAEMGEDEQEEGQFEKDDSDTGK